MMQLSKGHTPGFQYSSAKMTVGAILRSSPTPAAVMDKSATLHSGFSWNNRTASNGLHSNKKKKKKTEIYVAGVDAYRDLPCGDPAPIRRS